jgi:hypothetical protein
MLNKLTASVLALLTMSGFAYAQEATSQGNSTNFILVDYGFNLSADADVKESEAFNASNAIRLQDGVIDDANGFVGIGIGHRYANNFGAVLRYETGELESGTMTVDIFPNNADGVTAATIDRPFTTDVESFFLEGVYFVPYSEQIELWGLVGVGQSEVETSTNSVTFNETESETAICSSSEDNTATRFGIGATYYLDQTHGFYGGITMSNYGDASFKSTDDDGCTNVDDSMSLEDIEATDLRIGYFRSF